MADLTTLAKVKEYAPGLAPAATGTDDTFDVLLGRLITATSKQFEGEADRTIAAANYTELRHGNGKTRVTPRHFPVISVTSVTVDGTAVAQQTTVGGDGWVLADDAIYLVGSTFTEGVANVQIVYRAGFETIPEDIEQAVIKMVVLQFQDRKRIGVSSSSQGGTSTSFADGPVLAYWRAVVDGYRCPEV